MPASGSAGTGKTVLALDVGGTHSRARFARVGADGESLKVADSDAVAKVSSADAFADFLRHVLEQAPQPPDAVGAAFAGPVLMPPRVARPEVVVTNWTGTRRVSLDDLVSMGLPAGRTEMLNDMQAGAYGLLQSLRSPKADDFQCIHDPAGMGLPTTDATNLVLVNPGTGLGAAALVRADGAGGGHVAFSCEIGHTPMPPFSRKIAAATDMLSETLGRRAEWEDLCSGRGLPRLYRAVGGARSMADSGASAIAESALRATDDAAVQALDLYYRCVGRALQVMTLTVSPCSAAFLGGSDVEANLQFIPRSGLLEDYLDTAEDVAALRGAPLWITRGNDNLAGALSRAALRLART